MAFSMARVKAWARGNGGKIAAAGGALAVTILALRSRSKGAALPTVMQPQQLPIADGTYDGSAAAGDVFGQFSGFLSQLADTQSSQYEQLMNFQQNQAERTTSSLNEITSAQNSSMTSVTQLFAQQAAAQQKSTDSLTKALADAIKKVTSPKTEPKTPAAPKPAAKKKTEQAPAKKTDPKTTKVTVKSGESLSKIAAAAGISTAKIIKLNPQIKNPNLIYAGQKVVVKK